MCRKSFNKLILLLRLLITVASQKDDTAQPCNSTHGLGLCIGFKECPYARAILTHGLQVDRNLLLNLNCGFKGNEPFVCCPTSVNEDNIRFDNNKKIITATMRSTTLSSTSNETPTTTDKPTHAIRQRVTAEVITRVQEDSITTTSTESVIIVNENDHNKNKIDERPLPVKPLHEAKKEISRVSLLPSRNVCGQLSSISERIVGGDHTDPNEFPWTVRLKYPVRIDGKDSTKFGCGGTLISERYVITAAHCFTSSWKPTEVRLGEWNELTETDCSRDICIDPVIDVKIEKWIQHPNFTTENIIARSDIALVRLAENVNFTYSVSPICLPISDYMVNLDSTLNKYWATGWGRTEFDTGSPIKRKVQLNTVPLDTCLLSYSVRATRFLHESNIICAGGRKGQDTCSGDSGGPLMQTAVEKEQANWFLFGVISGGPRICGEEGRPGYNTRVTYYRDWILNNMEP